MKAVGLSESIALIYDEKTQNFCQKVLTYCNQVSAETPAGQI